MGEGLASVRGKEGTSQLSTSWGQMWVSSWAPQNLHIIRAVGREPAQLSGCWTLCSHARFPSVFSLTPDLCPQAPLHPLYFLACFSKSLASNSHLTLSVGRAICRAFLLLGAYSFENARNGTFWCMAPRGRPVEAQPPSRA